MNITSRDKQVFEILKELGEIKHEDLRAEWLRDNFSDHKPLHYILMMNFSDTIVSVFPEGVPPFNQEEQDGPSRSSLWQYLNVFPVFVQSAQSQKMTALKREQILIEMLEALDNEEALVFCAAKDRKLEESFDISLEVVLEAFPELGIVCEKPRVVKEKTPEEKAESLLAKAEELKQKAKEFNAEARKLTTEAKQLAKEA